MNPPKPPPPTISRGPYMSRLAQRSTASNSASQAESRCLALLPATPVPGPWPKTRGKALDIKDVLCDV
ncbi:MAG: hypothetical protein ACMUJM_18745 [bacterium]